MSGVEGLQEVGRFAAAHLADDDVIGPVPQGMAHEVADADGPVLYPRASNRTQFGRSVLSSKVSSMATIRFLRVAFQGSRITSDAGLILVPSPRTCATLATQRPSCAS